MITGAHMAGVRTRWTDFLAMEPGDDFQDIFEVNIRILGAQGLIRIRYKALLPLLIKRLCSRPPENPPLAGSIPLKCILARNWGTSTSRLASKASGGDLGKTVHSISATTLKRYIWF